MRIPKPIYRMKQHKRPLVALLLFLLPLASIYAIHSVLAAPTYTITPSPLRIQEGQSTALTMSITSGAFNMQYTFDINVTEPDLSMHTAQLTFTTDGSGGGSGAKNYPADFSITTPGKTTLLGTYFITVDQLSPIGASNPVATGSFVVGLTDSATYQRTNTVHIQAAGYGNGEKTTVDITTSGGSIHATGFPATVNATASGLVLTTWHIPVDARSGTWTVSVSGTSTTKAPVDQQTFTVTAATLLVTVTTDQTSYARTQVITAYATVAYPDGTILNSSYPTDTFANVRATFANGSATYGMNYNATSKLWYASYTVSGFINPSSLPFVYSVTVNANDQEPFPPSNSGTKTAYVTILLTPTSPDLQVTVQNSTGVKMAGVFLNITFWNGTVRTSAYTDANGNALFTMPTAYTYNLVASFKGYNDLYTSFYLQGNLMKLSLTMQNVLYTGSVLSGSFATAAHYNPGDSGNLEIWIYNQNTTFPITITKIEVQFPWFATYGNSYQGNVTVTLPSAGQIINPKTNWNTTVPFTVPNDGRIYTGVGGQIYISGTAPAWKTAYNITNTGSAVPYKKLDTALIDPYPNWAFGSYYSSHGFAPRTNIQIAFPTQDSGTQAQLNILELLMAIFLVNIVLLVLIWIRLAPIGKMTGVAKV